MNTRTRRDAVEPYLTLDGSEIRELMHPGHHAVRKQSFAEATVPPGGETRLHLHRTTEEIYHIAAGSGRMTLGTQVFAVRRGETIVIAAGTPHRIANTGRRRLRILCACSPAYSHEDTVLLGD